MEVTPNLTTEEMEGFSEALENSVPPAGRASAPEVRSYDFAHPDKLSKTHTKVLQTLLTSLEKSWSATLSSALKSEATVTLQTLEQVSLAAHAECIGDHCQVVSLSLGKLGGIALLDMPSEFGLCMVDRMVGGRGSVKGEARSFTQLERSIIRRMLDRLAADLAAALRPVTDVQIALMDFHDSAQEVGAGMGETFLVVGFVWNTLFASQNVSLAIQGSSLESLRDDLTSERLMSASQPSQSAAPDISLLGPVGVDWTVELGRATASMKDIISLGVGDIIKLDRSANDELDVKLQGITKFYGRPGLVGNRLSVQITERAVESDGPAAETGPSIQDLF
jgi:flagellar motor switch protein FliM